MLHFPWERLYLFWPSQNVLAKTYYYFSCGPRFLHCPRIRWSILPMITRDSLYEPSSTVSCFLTVIYWKLLFIPHLCLTSRLALLGRRCFIILGSQRMRWFFWPKLLNIMFLFFWIQFFLENVTTSIWLFPNRLWFFSPLSIWSRYNWSTTCNNISF